MQANLRDPSFLGALVYFERAAARLNFAQAAADLGVTPSAVSHRIASLESALGKRLFERSPRHVSLTREGVELAGSAREALTSLRRATDRIVGRRVLRVSVGPYLSTSWLMPRLAGFESAHPGLRIDLLHRAGWPDLRDVDLAIVWFDTPPATVHAELLFEPLCMAVAAPDALGEGPLWAQGLPPIHYRDRGPWRRWLRAVGGPEEFAEGGEIFDDPNIVLDAAAHGRGVALGFSPFIADRFAAGRLVSVQAETVRSDFRYWLVRGQGAAGLEDDFVAWLRAEVGAMEPRDG